MKKIIIAIIVTVLTVIILSVGIISYKRFKNNIEPLYLTKNFNGSEVSVNTTYDWINKKVTLALETNEIIENWQKEYYKEHNFIAEVSFKGNEIIKNQHLKSVNSRITVGQPLSFTFEIDDINTKQYVNIKKLIREHLSDNSFMLALQEAVVFNEAERNIIKENFIKEKEEQEKERLALIEEEKRNQEAMQYANEYAYRYDNFQAVPLGVNPRKCLFEVNGVCFGQPFVAKGISYMECKNRQNEFGIKGCLESDDIWAATVLICGGVQNLPSLDELLLLAKDMYKINSEDNIQEYIYSGTNEYMKGDVHLVNIEAERDNNKYYLDYFRNLFWNNRYFKDKYEEDALKNIAFSLFSSKENIYGSGARYFFKNKSTDVQIIGHTIIMAGDSKKYKFKDNISDIKDDVVDEIWYGDSHIPVSICVAKRDYKKIKDSLKSLQKMKVRKDTEINDLSEEEKI